MLSVEINMVKDTGMVTITTENYSGIWQKKWSGKSRNVIVGLG